MQVSRDAVSLLHSLVQPDPHRGGIARKMPIDTEADRSGTCETEKDIENVCSLRRRFKRRRAFRRRRCRKPSEEDREPKHEESHLARVGCVATEGARFVCCSFS